MERSEILTKLRGEKVNQTNETFLPGNEISVDPKEGLHVDWNRERFPPSFLENSPSNAQKIILWCLEREPTNRPTAQQLLSVSQITLRFFRVLVFLTLLSRVICYLGKSKLSNTIWKKLCRFSRILNRKGSSKSLLLFFSAQPQT